MLRKLNLFTFFISAFVLSSQSQEKIKEYEPPKVIEGSNLTLYAEPYLRYSNRDLAIDESKLTYYMYVSSEYTKWRFSERTDYSLRASLNTSLFKGPQSDIYGIETSAQMYLKGGISYYLSKNKLFAGIYSDVIAQFQKGRYPAESISLYPNIGFGKITDAIVVNEASNFENVLKDEKYINKPFDKKTRMLLNSLLDKRNGNVFSSIFKDDAEIEFFTELEKILLEEKIIDKPLNARATMKLFQTLYDGKFILFPQYKGYQFQAELGYQNSNYMDTLKYPLTLSLNAVYGIPLSSKTSVLFSVHYVFPVNNNYNTDFYRINMHSPIFIRSDFLNISYNNFLNSGSFSISRNLYDYKYSAGFYIFHYLNRIAGIYGDIQYDAGKQKAAESGTNYVLRANGNLVFNIINKLRLATGVGYYYNDKKEYYFTFNSGISYYIF